MKKLVKLAVAAGIACLCAFTVQGTGNSHASVQVNRSMVLKAEKRQDRKIYEYKQDKKRTSKFNSIKAECNSLDIVIDKSGSRNFYVSYNLNCENSSKPVSYKIEDGVLYIKESELEWPSVYINKWDKQSTNVNYKNYTNKIYVHIPSDTSLKSFDMDTKTGDLYIKNVSMEDGKITTRSGDLDIAAAKISGSFNIKTESGDAEFYNSSINGQMDVRTGSGDLYIKKSVVAKTYNIKTGSGDVEIYNSAINGEMDIQTGSGDVDTGNLGISGKAYIQTGSGDVDMMFNNKSIDKLGIVMVTRGGDMYINKSYKGIKRKKGYGYRYTKNISGNKITKPFLNVITGNGDIELS